MKKLPITPSLLLALLAASAFAETPGKINYQGKLIQGTNMVSGTVQIVFRIHTNESGGDYVYEETNQVLVVDGYYSTVLGDNPNHGELNNAVKHDDAFLSLTINGQTLFPREPFAPPPFAKSAKESWRLCGSVSSQFAGTVGSNASLWVEHLESVGYVAKLEDVHTHDEAENHSYAIFPPPEESRKITDVDFMLAHAYQVGSESNAPPTNRPAISVEIAGFTGAVKRVISPAVDLVDVPIGIWTSFALTNNRAARTLAPDELLLIHYDPRGTRSSYIVGWQHRLLFHVRVK